MVAMLSSLGQKSAAVRKGLVRGVFLLLVVYATTVIVLLALEDRFVFRPFTSAERWQAPSSDCDFQDEFITMEGATIHVRWFPCPGSNGVALFCHSQNANLSICRPAASVKKWHQETGLSVLFFDYPGYGRSSGTPSETSCYQAAETAYNWLVDKQEIAPAEIVVVGRSLGTAVAVELASRRPHRAIVLVSPFTSIPDVAQTRFPFLPAWLMRNRFDSLSRVGHCTGPTLIVHGTKDAKTPYCLAKQLFDAAPEPRKFLTVCGAGHGDAVLCNFFPELRRCLQVHTRPTGQ
ncbi:MAG: alpha/beta hydrolase [Planctomycetes bacterium]|nr:alpha/beta hydrolase [Planctomycetota bacterium]